MKLLDRVAALVGARNARRERRIQSLWSGYGEIFRVHLGGGPGGTAIVKHVRPPADAHPRKIRSYEVERAFYAGPAQRCGPACRVASCLGAWSDGHESVFVLEDLDAAGFPGRHRRLSDRQIRHCLSWLAAFHATYLGEAPADLWDRGTYWHLATRPDELERMRDDALRRMAPDLDAQLRSARWQTLVHGDAKPANFCFGADDAVAAVDFQYVGPGCGMQDVAYLLHADGSSPRTRRYLDAYFDALATHVEASRARRIEEEWRALYDVAWLDFLRFLDGWR